MHRSGYYRLERQLPGGIRTRKESAPFHGARKESSKFNQNFSDDVPRWPITTRSDPITWVFTAFDVTQAVPIRLLPCRDTYCILP